MGKENVEQLVGLLVIGDPHLEGRQPDFRKDDYPETVLGKVEWCLEYARSKQTASDIFGGHVPEPAGQSNLDVVAIDRKDARLGSRWDFWQS